MRRRRKKKKRRIVTIPVASMGDIAFLLIIFFLLLSDSIKDKQFPMTLPGSSKVKKIDIVVAARVDIDKDGVIYLDGNRVNSDKDIEVGVGAMLKGTISDDQRHVQFRCDKSQPRDVFVPVLQAIAEAGGIIEAVGEKD
jgi:biopolymer transport protein ExbD